MARWRVWWKRANLEQFLSFAVVAALSITAFSLIAYSTVFGNPDLPDSSGFDFISLEADALDARVGEWFGTLFLAIGAVSLFAAALGIVDYVSRLVADVVRVGYTSDSARWTESRVYLAVVWTMIIFGTAILLAGFDQPLVLVTISTVLGGFIMFVYSCLLVVTNRRYLPRALKLRGYRLAVIGFAIALLGVTTGDRRRRPVRQAVLMRRSIATVCLSGTLEDKLAAAAAAGFDEVELFEPDLIALRPGRRRRCAGAPPTSASRSASTSRSATSRPSRRTSCARTCGGPSASSR